MIYLSYLFLGVILGVLASQYLFPIIDIYLDLFSYKQSEKATEHQLNTQIMTMEFQREYPEANKNYQELQQAIGFTVNNNSEKDELYEDDKCSENINKQNRIGY